MVKPPRTMQPEAVDDMEKAGRTKTKSFQQDSFHNYMARKISLQRQQFGLMLPPPPSEQDHSKSPLSVLRNKRESGKKEAASTKVSPQQHRVHFSPNLKSGDCCVVTKQKQNEERGLDSILKRLKRRHGKGDVSNFGLKDMPGFFLQPETLLRSKLSLADPISLEQQDNIIEHSKGSQEKTDAVSLIEFDDCASSNESYLRVTKNDSRPDLFFTGVVVLVNGDTNPDADTLQRLLHRYGGNLEKYETSLVTHVIAEHLSFAKAKMYRNSKRSPPVVYPSWITDSIAQKRLLPASQYILQEFRQEDDKNQKSLDSFFHQPNNLREVVPPINRGALGSRNDVQTLPLHNATVTLQDFSFSRVGENANGSNCLEDTPPLEAETKELHTPIPGDFLATNTASCKNIKTTPSLRSSSELDNRILFSPQQNDPVAIRDNMRIDHSSNDEPREMYEEKQLSGESNQDSLGNHSLPQHDSRELDCHRSDCVDVENIVNTVAMNQSMSVKADGESFECDDDDTTVLAGGQVKSAQDGDNQQQIQHRESKSEKVSPSNQGRTDEKYINGRIRTVGTDPNFLDSFFRNSRLSYIGSFKQRLTHRSDNRGIKKGKPDGRRFVFHVDLDCFFAAVVLRKFPQYKNCPVVISHHGKSANETGPQGIESLKGSTSECATCNYEARKYGIKKGMFLGRAKELCPDLVVLSYDFEGYKEVSNHVADILFRVAGDYRGAVEEVSCDESYLQLEMEDESEALQVAESIRNEILNETGCTATVGVATNKFLAKLATDHVKPNRSLVVEDEQALLRNLKLADLHGVGHRSEAKLAQHGFVTVEDLWKSGNSGIEELKKILGEQLGKKIWLFCQGQDDRPVESSERKTIGAECNYGVRFDGPYGVDHMIQGLAKEVENRMEAAGLKGTKVTLKVKKRKPDAPTPGKFLGHGSCFNISKSMDASHPTRDCSVLAKIGSQLFSQLKLRKEDVRGMGLVVSSLIEGTVSDGILRYFQKNPDHSESSTNITRKRLDKQDEAQEPKPINLSDDSSVELIEDLDEIATLDIDLPSCSQIHMSQVNQLPTALQKHIKRKIEENKLRSQKKIKSGPPTIFHPPVDAVHQRGPAKAGKKPTIAMQATEKAPQLKPVTTRSLQFVMGKTGKPKRDENNKCLLENTKHECKVTMIPVDQRDLFQENVLPLSKFLDQNPPNDASQNLVLCFFDQLLEGSSLRDVLVLLRSIQNRGDEWSSDPFESIRQMVDSKAIQLHGMPLDMDD